MGFGVCLGIFLWSSWFISQLGLWNFFVLLGLPLLNFFVFGGFGLEFVANLFPTWDLTLGSLEIFSVMC